MLKQRVLRADLQVWFDAYHLAFALARSYVQHALGAEIARQRRADKDDDKCRVKDEGAEAAPHFGFNYNAEQAQRRSTHDALVPARLID